MSYWRSVRLKRPGARAPAAPCRERCATRRDSAGAPGRRTRTRRPTRAGATRPDPAPQAAEQKARGVAERHRHDRQAGRDRSRALVLVLMQPHPAFGIVVVEDAEVGVERHARRPRAMSRASCANVGGQRRRRQVVEVAARRLVAVGLAVPMTAEAQHADVHLAAAADDRHVGGHGAVDERAALVRRARAGRSSVR